jgi:hypothetical protein
MHFTAAGFMGGLTPFNPWHPNIDCRSPFAILCQIAFACPRLH